MKKAIMTAIIGISILNVPSSVLAKDMSISNSLQNTRMEATVSTSPSVTVQPSTSRATIYGSIGLSGYVKDANGKPMAHKNVFLMEGDKYIDNRYTDENGYFNCPDCPCEFLGAGSHNITAYVSNETLNENATGKYIFHIDNQLMGFDIKSEQGASFYIAYR